MKNPILHIILAILLTGATLPGGCSRREAPVAALDRADSFIESQPDSALAVLCAIDTTTLTTPALAARYGLLMSMALDKNYIDTTDFAIITPAVDYYLEHGTPDERLRTLYYTGVIHKNRGERSQAMTCFMDAAELRAEVTDTLVLARNFVMQGVYYFDQYQLGSATDKYLQAAQLYEHQRPDLAMDCYLRALYASVAKDNHLRADSIMKICDDRIAEHPDYRSTYHDNKLAYLIDYGSEAELRNELSNYSDTIFTNWKKYIYARVYHRLGHAKLAKDFLDSINPEEFSVNLDMVEYLRGEVLMLTKDYKSAAECYRRYIDMSAKDYASLLNSELPFSDTRHKIKLEHISELHRRNAIILDFIIVVCVIALLACYSYYRYYRTRTERILAEEQNRILALQNDKLLQEKEKAEIEKRTSELDIENLRLRNEANELSLANLQLEKARLEREGESLRKLLEEKSDLDLSVRKIIFERLELLNCIIAQEITKKQTLGTPYQKFITQIHNDKEQFLESTRLAFSVSHPQFMQYLVACGLNTEEIHLCCLYAIGLRGKEIGEYTYKKRHYIISSEIRKKFGLTEHDTNLGKYIQRLLRGDFPNT